MTVYAAYLRVYEPLGAFPDEDAQRFRGLLEARRLLDRRRAIEAEHQATLRAVVSTPVTFANGREVDAIATTQDGVAYICPLDLRVRCWEALAEFRQLLPDPLAEAFVPGAVAAWADAEADAWQRAHPDARPHVLTGRWQVPLRWLVLFDPGERRLMLGPRVSRYAAVGGASARDKAADLSRCLVYTTAMSRARRRLARTLAVVRRTIEEGPIAAGIEDLGRWLEAFHPHSLVELDYGGLVHLIDDDTLRDDESVADIAAAVAALGSGDAAGATAGYERVINRWRPVASLESAN
ncbi:MAG: hypothetical protein ACJ735_02195 [Actinomycetes bacterium]